MASEIEHPDHLWDESKPSVFLKHIGPVGSCTCGRDRVAGRLCPADPGHARSNAVPTEETK